MPVSTSAFYQLKRKKRWIGGLIHLIESLPSMYEALSMIPNIS